MALRILITGGSGFVGKVLIAELRRSYPHALIFAMSRGRPDDLDGVEWLKADLLSSDLTGLLANARPTHIAHLAAYSSVAEAERASIETVDANLLGSIRLVDAIAASAPEARVLFASSGEVYGKAFSGGGGPLTERSPVFPANVYARSKLAAEFALTDRLPPTASLAILRSLNHIGAGQDARFVVASFARQIAEIEAGLRAPSISVGNLSAERDFSDVVDVVRAYQAVLLDATMTSGAEVFNVSSQRLRSIRSVLDDLIALSPATFSIDVDPGRLRPVDVARTELSSAKLRQRFGWVPSTPWEDTVAVVLNDARRRFGRLHSGA